MTQILQDGPTTFAPTSDRDAAVQHDHQEQPPTLEALAAEYHDLAERASRHSAENDRLEVEQEHQDKIAADAFHRGSHAEQALARRILEAAGIGRVDERRWYHDRSPLATMRIGRRTYHLICNIMQEPPESIDQAEARVVLTHIDDPAENYDIDPESEDVPGSDEDYAASDAPEEPCRYVFPHHCYLQPADLVRLPVVPRPDPIPGVIDTPVTMAGDDFTLRAWPPELGPDGPGCLQHTHVWEAATPGWRFQVYRHGDNPEMHRQFLEDMAEKGLRPTADGKGLEKIPPEPIPPSSLEGRALVYAGRVKILVREIEAWEAARSTMIALESTEKPAGEEDRKAWRYVVDEAAFSARQAEAALGERLSWFFQSERPDVDERFDCDRMNPVGVRYRDMQYILVRDPIEGRNDDEGTDFPHAIVARVEWGQMLSIPD